MITREQVADLQPGDVVELGFSSGAIVRGPLVEDRHAGGLDIAEAGWSVRCRDGALPYGLERIASTLTVVSRAPRPLHDCPDCTHTAATVKVGDAWTAPPTPERFCGASSREGYLCCLARGHDAPHIAGNGTRAVAVWS